jgi:hypothetical protein
MAVRIALEPAVAVGERAVGAVQPDDLAKHAIEGFDDVDAFADLDAVGADVLDRRGADGAGNQREVLQSTQPASQRPQHQRMPLDAGIRPHDRARAVVLDDANLLSAQRQHRSRRVAREQQVAAAAEHEDRTVAQHRVAEQFRQRGGVGDFDEHRRGGAHAEGIARIQPRVLDDPVTTHAGRRQSCGGTLPRLGASLRRRMASTHSPMSAGPR